MYRSKWCGAEDPTEGQENSETEEEIRATSKEQQGLATLHMNRTFRYL